MRSKLALGDPNGVVDRLVLGFGCPNPVMIAGSLRGMFVEWPIVPEGF